MSKIRLTNVSKIFGDHPERARELLAEGRSKEEILEETGQVVAVQDVSLDIEEGEIFVVMGLSGSGKSTLVRMFNRLFDPTSGSVEIDGRDITTLSDAELRRLRARQISMVFQRFALFPHRTVRENVAFGLEVQKVSADEREQRATEALGMVGLEGWGDSYPSQLSGGMQQRVGLARALATNADVLLMDEAFSALDPLIRREMQDQLLSLQETLRKTIIFITHDLNEAMRLGDRIAVMKDGAVVQVGTAEEILTNPANDYVAAFIQDVDPNRVLTASSIMREPIAVVSPRVGPRVAMEKLQEVQRSELYAMTPDRRLAGYVRDQDLADAARRGATNLQDVLRDDFPSARPDDLISSLYGMAAEHALPVAVVDDDGRLLGVVPRVSLLNALARTEGRLSESGSPADGPDDPSPDLQDADRQEVTRA